MYRAGRFYWWNYYVVCILMSCLALNQQFKLTSIQTRSHVDKRGALEWLTDECLSLRLLDGETILSLAQATTTTSNKFVFIGK